jgi:hypothetical protein
VFRPAMIFDRDVFGVEPGTDLPSVTGAQLRFGLRGAAIARSISMVIALSTASRTIWARFSQASRPPFGSDARFLAGMVFHRRL